MARSAFRTLILAGAAVLLSACGIKGPLEPPGGTAATQTDASGKPAATGETTSTNDDSERILKTPHKP